MVWISRAERVGGYSFSYALWARNLNYLNYIVCPLIGLDSLDFSSGASRMFYFSYALWARNLNYLNYIVCPLIGLDSLDFSSAASRMLYFSYAHWASNLNYLNYIFCPLIGLDSLDFSSAASRMLFLPCFRACPCSSVVVICGSSHTARHLRGRTPPSGTCSTPLAPPSPRYLLCTQTVVYALSSDAFCRGR